MRAAIRSLRTSIWAKDESGLQWLGVFLRASYDGNPLFFPADVFTPYSLSSMAHIPGNYDAAWPEEPKVPLHNFSFTTEARFWFRFDASKTYQLTFAGDDDVWIFVNKQLAIDLGGIHYPVEGTLTIIGTTATAQVLPLSVSKPTALRTTPRLNLENGQLYEVAVFHAERQSTVSGYSLKISKEFAEGRSVCTKP